MKRGEVRWATLDQPWGRRPVVLIARDHAYDILTRAVVAPLTTTLRVARTIVLLDPHADGVPLPSAISLDSLQAIPVTWIEPTVVARLTPEQLEEVDRALHFALGITACPT